jgi:hypothetical protein
MFEQSSTVRTYARDAYAPGRRDAHAGMEKISGWLHTSAFPLSNFEESVLDRSGEVANPSGEVANPWNQLISNYNSKEFQ